MTEATVQIPGTSGPKKALSETIKLSLSSGGFWALAIIGPYAQPQLLESAMADDGALEGAVGHLVSIENDSIFARMSLASGPIARISRTRT